MASALTVLFLGCWLAGQSRARRQEPLPKASISASPGGVIPVGTHVTIRCWTEQLGVRFLLYKDGDGTYLKYTDPAGSEAEFPIASARREDGGNYTCRYSTRTEAAAYSVSSDPVQIIVLGEGLCHPNLMPVCLCIRRAPPKPSISASPGGVIPMGGHVTIRCWAEHQAGTLPSPRMGMGPVQITKTLLAPRLNSPPPAPGRTTGAATEQEPGSGVRGRDSPGDELLPLGGLSPVSRSALPSASRVSFALCADIEVVQKRSPKPKCLLMTILTQKGRQILFFALCQSAQALGCITSRDQLNDERSYLSPENPAFAQEGSEGNVCKARPMWTGSSNECLGGPRPKPSISASPRGVIPVGTHVTIRCWTEQRGVRFLLYKDGAENYLNYRDSAGSDAEFRIFINSRQHGGNYTCRYGNKAGAPPYSAPSDPVQIMGHLPHAVRASSPTETHRSWSCRRPGQAESPKVSWVMQRLLLTATARDVNCRLWSRHEGHRKRQDIVIFLSLQPPAELRIWGWVQLGTGRGWQCREASHCPAMASALTVLFLGCCLAGQSRAQGQGSPKNGNKQTDSKQRAEGPSPKPSISASPGGVIPVGTHVTIRCWTEQRGRRFLLYKDGAENYLNYTDPAGSEAEFRIFINSREHGGNYTCRYSNRAGAAAYSAPSDPVQIMVLEGPLPKPSISASPGGVIPVGGNVTIRCCTEQLGMRFLLYKDGNGTYLNYTDPAGSEAEFTIASARREHGGNYTCRYSNRTGAPPYSEFSDPVQIMVQDAGSTSAEGTNRTQQETPSTPSPSATDAGSTPTSGTSTTQRETPSTPSPSATDAGSTPTRGPISAPLLEGAGMGQQVTNQPLKASCCFPDGSGSDLSGAIVAGVIVGAAGLLLLLLGFLCHRRTRAREGPASRQSRESEAATTVYALAGLGKQQDVPKPDPGAEGLTYTELDRQALQAKQEVPKQDAQVPAPEPVLYATVSRSQGAPQPPP
ncbi:LOW QUALITY PROTEIN: immunoglobulin superfamily member 1-like [Pelodiscus sinensis]|uniref:LOW QUALITY PROTEIN: immunoglobulin superfamily member 1-like n=1 Tax=Pelodiscus sinensis TaxID=13735 RepID=UPI003F6AA3B4